MHDLLVQPGRPFPLGPTVVSTTRHHDGRATQCVNLAVFSRKPEISLCLFAPLRAGDDPVRDVATTVAFPACTQHVYHIRLENLPVDCAYAIHVVISPTVSRLLTDIYAPAIESAGVLGWMIIPGESGGPNAGATSATAVRKALASLASLRKLHVDYPFRPARFAIPVSASTFDWHGTRRPGLSLNDVVIYEAHARGLAPDGSLEGAVNRIPYLKWLGVTAVQLLPVFEFAEAERGAMDGEFSLLGKPIAERRGNFWGYNPLSWFAPMNRFSREPIAGGPLALKTFVRALHEAGIECYLDVVYNHTSNSSCALHFLDVQRDYYLNDARGSDGSFKHSNISGCGNTLSSNSDTVTQLIVRSLRHFVTEYHIDGFRFDAAGILCRDKDGVPTREPDVVRALASDDVLCDVKFIVEGWDAGDQMDSPNMLLGSKGGFPHGDRFCEWNARFRDIVRVFVGQNLGVTAHDAMLRGCGAFRSAVAGSPMFFAYGGLEPSGGRPLGANHSINFVSCHDGFAMVDLVTYAKRKNEDGYGEISFNCDAAGELDDNVVTMLKARVLRMLVFVLSISRGVPMILQGDEMGFSKGGNSNTWNDRNTYICRLPEEPERCADWERLVVFTRDMFKLRRDLLVLRGSDFYSDVTWLDSSGKQVDEDDIETADVVEAREEEEELRKAEELKQRDLAREKQQEAKKTREDDATTTTKLGSVTGEIASSVKHVDFETDSVKAEGIMQDGGVEGVQDKDTDLDSKETEAKGGEPEEDNYGDSFVAFIAPSLHTVSTMSVEDVSTTKVMYVAFNNSSQTVPASPPCLEMTAGRCVQWTVQVDTYSSQWRQNPPAQHSATDLIQLGPHSAVLFTASFT